MTQILSLAHLTLIDGSPVDLIDAAAAAGFSYVGLRVIAREPRPAWMPVVGNVQMEREIKRRLAATGTKVLDLEVFWLTPDFQVADHVPALALGGELGARYVVVICDDPDRSRAIENFARLCEAAKPFHIRPALEFIPYTQVVTLAHAVDMLQAASAANAGLLLDLLHLSRSGGSPGDLARVAPGLINLAHVCDAPAAIPQTISELRHEAREDRMYPGEGALPISAFLAALPAETPIALEAPNPRAAHLSFAERARHAYASMKRIAG
ncbi:MAG: sugar phosphate isomerase/epimerase family protein [Hyphomicrobiaceae bacterium]